MNNINSQAEIALLRQLIEHASVTPDDAGCQALIIQRLEAIGFQCETLVYGEVTNLWATRGTGSPLLCFAGHTDVVPPGDLSEWATEPFVPVERDGMLFGRGSADMKSGLAAMIVAIEQYVANHPDHNGRLAMLITSDEEGRARDGTRKVIQELQQRGERINWCILGEPSSQHHVGDLIRVGRRGSLSGLLTLTGIQGHVAYPQFADNPIHRFADVLHTLCNTEWDQGNDYFPPTSFQVVDIQSGVGAPNVTPAGLNARFNFRYSTEWTHESLKNRVHEIFESHGVDKYKLKWHLSGEPFLTQPGELIDAVVQSVSESTGQLPKCSTGGGTSDGRFIAPAGTDVVELGPVNASIHKVNEHVRIDDVIALTGMYRRIIERLL